MSAEFRWFVDSLTYYRGVLAVAGWAFDTACAVREIGLALSQGSVIPLEGYGVESPDVEAVYGAAARRCRFVCQVNAEQPEHFADARLYVRLENGEYHETEPFMHRRLDVDPYYRLQMSFFDMLRQIGHGRILEIGSRDRRHDRDSYPLLRSTYVRRELIPPTLQYIGMDIVAADNVDVVADAHALSSVFEPEYFDAVIAAYVFEHLLMPWKVALELNHIMKTGAVALILTHHTWPLHEQPWDFWRFSDQAWKGLFNTFTCFVIVEAEMGEPASIVPQLLHATTLHLDLQPANLMSGVIVKKVGRTALRWDADAGRILTEPYPC